MVNWVYGGMFVTHRFALNVPNFSSVVQSHVPRETTIFGRFFMMLEMNKDPIPVHSTLLCYIAIGGTMHTVLSIVK